MAAVSLSAGRTGPAQAVNRHELSLVRAEIMEVFARNEDCTSSCTAKRFEAILHQGLSFSYFDVLSSAWAEGKGYVQDFELPKVNMQLDLRFAVFLRLV
jgi:hypothetical protein